MANNVLVDNNSQPPSPELGKWVQFSSLLSSPHLSFVTGQAWRLEVGAYPEPPDHTTPALSALCPRTLSSHLGKIISHMVDAKLWTNITPLQMVSRLWIQLNTTLANNSKVRIQFSTSLILTLLHEWFSFHVNIYLSQEKARIKLGML